MPYIHITKEIDHYQIFGSLPVMCKKCTLDLSKLEYHFNRAKNDKFENEVVKIVKVTELKRGGKNNYSFYKKLAEVNQKTQKKVLGDNPKENSMCEYYKSFKKQIEEENLTQNTEYKTLS